MASGHAVMGEPFTHTSPTSLHRDIAGMWPVLLYPRIILSCYCRLTLIECPLDALIS